MFVSCYMASDVVDKAILGDGGGRGGIVLNQFWETTMLTNSCLYMTAPARYLQCGILAAMAWLGD